MTPNAEPPAAIAAAPVATEPLYAILTRALGASIETGRIPRGQVLQEATLARRLGLSRAPVRKAFALLAEAGLLVQENGVFRVSGGPDRTDGTDEGFDPESADLLAADDLDRLRRAGAVWRDILEIVEAEIGAAIPFADFRVSEARMAAQFGVSRTVIRTVLGRLEDRGLVQKDTRGGWSCERMTVRTIRDIYELRMLLEPHALALAAPRLDPGWVVARRAALEAALRDYPEVAAETLQGFETDLHVRAYEGIDNALIRRTLATTRTLIITTSRLFQMHLGLPLRDPFLAEHLTVFRQLEAGATEVAVAALRHHLRRAQDTSLERFELLAGRPLPPVPDYLLPQPQPQPG